MLDLKTKIIPYFAMIEKEDEKQRDLFLDSFLRLPSNLRDFVTSEETAAMIYRAGISGGMAENKIERLSLIVRDFIVGKIKKPQLNQVLSEFLALSGDNLKNVSDFILKALPMADTTPTTNQARPVFVPSQPLNQNNIIDLRSQEQAPPNK